MATEFRFKPIVPKKMLPDSRQITTALVKAMSDTVKNGQKTMQSYPPQTLMLTGYVRTGTLRRSWSSEVKPGGNRIVGIVGSNSNIAPYNRLVQGQQQMTAFDIANWPNVNELKDQMGKELSRRAESQLERLFR